MEAKIECDLIFIRAAEEMAGLSCRQVMCVYLLKDKTGKMENGQRNKR